MTTVRAWPPSVISTLSPAVTSGLPSIQRNKRDDPDEEQERHTDGATVLVGLTTMLETGTVKSRKAAAKIMRRCKLTSLQIQNLF